MDILAFILLGVCVVELTFIFYGLFIIARQRSSVSLGKERAMKYLKLTNASATDAPQLTRLDKQIVMAKTMKDARIVRGEFASIAESLEV